jgi:hypothetical protein
MVTTMASAAADAILVIHFLFIAFVVVGQVCILLGGPLRWAWVRNRAFRFTHLTAIAVITVQAWLGMICPLTAWEQSLRRAAGEEAYEGTFVGYWLGRLIYCDAPFWAFVILYTLFGGVVVASWFLVRPVRRDR